MNSSELRLCLVNQPAALEPARQAMLAFLVPAALSSTVVYQLELVLEETFMNLLWHAYTDGAEHHIDVTVQLQPDDVVLRFEDDGVAFDPTQAAEPERPASLLEAPTGGRGLALVRRAAHSVGYERCEGRNRLRIAVARR